MHQFSGHEKNARWPRQACSQASVHKKEMEEPMAHNLRRLAPQKKYPLWHLKHIPCGFHVPCPRREAIMSHHFLTPQHLWMVCHLLSEPSLQALENFFFAIFQAYHLTQLSWQNQQQMQVLCQLELQQLLD